MEEKKWDVLASNEVVEKTAEALRTNGFVVHIAENTAEAKKKVLEILQEGVEVMDMRTLSFEQIGLREVFDSGRYNLVRTKFMDKNIPPREKKRLGAAPEWVIGSAQALTEDGHLLHASRTGSQLPAYAYGADHVILLVGGQKVVRDVPEGIRRIYEHALPLEDARARKAYGISSAVNKLLIYNAESTKDRTTVVIVKENLGF